MRLAKFLLVIVVLLPAWAGAALPSNELWRLSLLNECVGYGCASIQGVGDSNWNLCTVSNGNNSGAGSLRVCLESTTTNWIVFSFSGNIDLTGILGVKSNKVVDGRNADISIRCGFGVSTIGEPCLMMGRFYDFVNNTTNNVVFSHLKFPYTNANTALDVGVKGSNVWVHHCTFQYGTDDMVHMGGYVVGHGQAAPDNLTLSWNHWLPHGGTSPPSGQTWLDKCFLAGDPAVTDDATGMHVTLHHNHANHMNERCWLIYWGRYHSYNNWYDTGQGNIMTQTGSGAHFRSEHDILERNDSNVYPWFNFSEYASVYPPAGKIRVDNPYVINSAPYEENDRNNVFNPATDYSYTPETANSTLRTSITTNAGWQSVTAPSGTVPVVLRLIR
jgi:pectate lyase